MLSSPAATSNSLAATLVNTLSHPISEKLTRENFLLWKAQVVPAMKGTQLFGYLDGSTKAPAQEIMVKKADKSIETREHPAYFSKMRGYADEMAAAGEKMDDDDLISYILAGL